MVRFSALLAISARLNFPNPNPLASLPAEGVFVIVAAIPIRPYSNKHPLISISALYKMLPPCNISAKCTKFI